MRLSISRTDLIMECRPTTRYHLAVTGCIAFCLALTQGLTPNHPHFPSQSIALAMLYTIAVALMSHAILIFAGSKVRFRILIGTLVTTVFCAALIRSGYFDWHFILPDRVDSVLTLVPMTGAIVFYFIDAWFWMYRETLFAPAASTSG